MKLIHKIGAVVGSGAIVALGLGAASAVPAMASDCVASGTQSCATVTVTVPAAITLGNVDPNIAFPAPTPGSNDTATTAETEYVVTNDSNGYTLSLTAGGTQFTGTFGNTPILNSGLYVAETVDGGSGNNGPTPSSVSLASGTALLYTSVTPSGTFPDSGTAYAGPQIYTPNGKAPAGADVFDESWQVSIPGTLDSASYSETFTYLADES